MILSDRSINEALASGRLGMYTRAVVLPRTLARAPSSAELGSNVGDAVALAPAHAVAPAPAHALAPAREGRPRGPAQPRSLNHAAVPLTTLVTTWARTDDARTAATSGVFDPLRKLTRLVHGDLARIGQLSSSLMTTAAEMSYGAQRGSTYSGQQLPTASRLYLDFHRLYLDFQQ